MTDRPNLRDHHRHANDPPGERFQRELGGSEGNHDRDAAASASHISPPVAPAIVLDHRNGSMSSYPVANLVNSFVQDAIHNISVESDPHPSRWSQRPNENSVAAASSRSDPWSYISAAPSTRSTINTDTSVLSTGTDIYMREPNSFIDGTSLISGAISNDRVEGRSVVFPGNYSATANSQHSLLRGPSYYNSNHSLLRDRSYLATTPDGQSILRTPNDIQHPYHHPSPHNRDGQSFIAPGFNHRDGQSFIAPGFHATSQDGTSLSSIRSAPTTTVPEENEHPQEYTVDGQVITMENSTHDNKYPPKQTQTQQTGGDDDFQRRYSSEPHDIGMTDAQKAIKSSKSRFGKITKFFKKRVDGGSSKVTKGEYSANMSSVTASIHSGEVGILPTYGAPAHESLEFETLLPHPSVSYIPEVKDQTRDQQQQQQSEGDGKVSPSKTASPSQNRQQPPKKERKKLWKRGAPKQGPPSTGGGGLEPLDSHLNSDPVARMPEPMSLSGGGPNHSGGSVKADYIGSFEGGNILSALALATAYDENDEYALKQENNIPLPLRLYAETADLKVDKSDTPDVEALLRRAYIESSDLEPIAEVDTEAKSTPTGSVLTTDSVIRGVPLSQALPHHTQVYNDTLKVVVVSAPDVDKSWVARRLRNSKKPPNARKTLAVDVHGWRPDLPIIATGDTGKKPSDIRCQVWDVQGASKNADNSRPNFGAHPGTQSLFFSDQSLYLLVWDLAYQNPKTNRREIARNHNDDDDDESEEDDDDDFAIEEANRQADIALYADITNRVLSWFDCIAPRGPRSAILPVALIPHQMKEFEVARRCSMMQNLLEEHVHRYYASGTNVDGLVPKLLTGSEGITCVHYDESGKGIEQLQETVMAIANDTTRSVFDHVGTPVPYGTVLVLASIKKFKTVDEHKLILLDHLIGDIGDKLDNNTVVNALQFLSNIGEILYFGEEGDNVLKHFVVLSRKWLVSALSSILRNDWKQEVTEVRRFMNMQSVYSDAVYEENEIVRTLVSGNSSSCPLLSSDDAKMIWQAMTFMREASDNCSSLLESSTDTPTIFSFFERLLVHAGVFIPLETSSMEPMPQLTSVFFVPSLLAQADPPNLWHYGTNEGWLTTLCHSWLFRDGAPAHIMEHVTVRLLADLYEFSRTFQAAPPTPTREPMRQIRTTPVGRQSFENFVESHGEDAIGFVRIQQVVCFKGSLLIKIEAVFADDNDKGITRSSVDMFVCIADQSSPHSVASDVMRPSMQRLIVSGKGEVGHLGLKLWKGGYSVVLESVQKSLSNYSNVDAQVICPDCLASSGPQSASTWGWDSVQAMAQSRNPHVICLRGHRVNSHLICGTCPDRKKEPTSVLLLKPLNISYEAIVLVAVWDPDRQCIVSVGSGFVADKKLGLVITAAHVLFELDGSKANFGLPYFGHKHARAVIGVIPDGGSGKHAVFRYMADIVAYKVHSVDACVLRIRSRLEADVDDKAGIAAIAQEEKMITVDKMPKEDLKSLKMKKTFELEEHVRLMGYSQGGGGIYEQGRHINRSVDVVNGYVCSHFKPPLCDDNSSSSENMGEPRSFSPQEEIVVMCNTISGHSGGPCINNEGKVLGILSRSDPVERQRCYLVPATEIKELLTKAKGMIARPGKITAQQTM